MIIHCKYCGGMGCESCGYGSGRATPPSPSTASEVRELPLLLSAAIKARDVLVKLGTAKLADGTYADKDCAITFALTELNAALAAKTAEGDVTCQWPTCQPADVQKSVAAQVFRELYSGQDTQPSTGEVDVEAERGPIEDFEKWLKGRGALGAGAVPARIFIAGWLAGQRRTQAEGARDAAHHIRMWLRAQANAESDPKARAAFIEAHNAALAIIEGRAAIAATQSTEQPHSAPLTGPKE